MYMNDFLTGSHLQVMPQAQAGLLSKDAVTNARALLRYALPVDEQKAKPIRQVQVSIALPAGIGCHLAASL